MHEKKHMLNNVEKSIKLCRVSWPMALAGAVPSKRTTAAKESMYAQPLLGSSSLIRDQPEGTQDQEPRGYYSGLPGQGT